MLPEPLTVESSEFEEAIPKLPNSDAVFVVWAGEQSAYLAKTSMLRRRLMRILSPEEGPRRMLRLRGVATRIEIWQTASRFESGMLHYFLARRHHPDDYLRRIKLRLPAYVRLTLSNTFPRTMVTTRLGGQSLYYGPFRTRAAAEQFETQVLDLFQIRRCQEDLEPRPDHPGCIYGEMNLCLRPCQQVVGVEEYRSEARRVAEFLTYNGKLMLASVASARDRLSEDMYFEEAARQHKRLERIEQVLALRDDLACDIDRLYGVAVTPSLAPGAVKLWFICQGCWQEPAEFTLASDVSLDRRLRELVASLEPGAAARQERQEHLALLARWCYSSWRDGEWLPFSSLEEVPYRKLVRAISRTAATHVN
jgi:hypothetical protein